MSIQKSDIVRSRVRGANLGNGFVHYILPDGEACVEFPVMGKLFIDIKDLERVNVDPRLNAIMEKYMS